MKFSINLELDDLQALAIDKVTHSGNRSRAQFIRNAIYTALWNARYGGPPLKTAPSHFKERGPASVGKSMIRFIEGRWVIVDDWGLATDRDLSHDIRVDKV